MNRPGILSLSFVALLATQRLPAAENQFWDGRATLPVPAGASIKLEFDRADYFLGENVLVHFVLTNISSEPFEFSHGGDYRGASRSLRFQVTATDDNGRVAEDPDPSPTCFGGLGGQMTLKPGEKFVWSLPLMRYCQIEQPGRYAIRATHDFGWKEDGRKRPFGEATVTFRMPDVGEAERIVTSMEKLPNSPNAVFGQRAHDYADFSCLRQPVYLEPLVRRARSGNQGAFAGLGLIPTSAATAVLIKLAADSDTNLALAAAQTLIRRLPVPDSERPSSRQWLAVRTWDVKFSSEVQTLARKLLANKETQAISCGAVMVGSVGTTNDAPFVLAALDRTLEPLVNPRRDPKDNIINFPSPLWDLLRVMQALHARGFTLPENLSGEAQFLVYFDWLKNEPPPRPQRWLELLDVFGENSRYPTRETALRSIPQPVPAESLRFIKRGLVDPDFGVCRTACTLAGQSGNREFLKPLIEIIATEQHEWLLREAGNAARALGGGFELLETWADRLTTETACGIALDNLQTELEGLPSSNYGRTDLTRSERLDLRKQWKEFLAQHAEEIRKGKHFKIGDPAIKPELFGRARGWQLADGTYWPMSSSDQARGPH